jgi:hypothetical protein
MNKHLKTEEGKDVHHHHNKTSSIFYSQDNRKTSKSSGRKDQSVGVSVGAPCSILDPRTGYPNSNLGSFSDIPHATLSMTTRVSSNNQGKK